MRSLHLAGAAILALAIGTSCSKGEESELKIIFPGATTYAVPGVGTSCSSAQAGDLTEDHFSYRNLTLTWGNATDSVYVLAIKLEFKHPSLTSGVYSCFITGDELGAVFASGLSPWDGSLYPAKGAVAGKLSISNSCSLSCGGVKYTAGISTTTAVGNVTVIGIQRSPEGDEKPVKGTGQVKLNFGGI